MEKSETTDNSTKHKDTSPVVLGQDSFSLAVPLAPVGVAGAWTPLNTPSGEDRAETPVIVPPGIDGPNAQMVIPLRTAATRVLVISPPGEGSVMTPVMTPLCTGRAEAGSLVIRYFLEASDVSKVSGVS